MKPRVIANYMGWNFVRKLGSYTDKRFRDIELKFNQHFNKQETGVDLRFRDIELKFNQHFNKQETGVDLRGTCMDSISSQLPYAVSRLYIDKHFTQNDKQEASNLVNDVKKAYYELIEEYDWLDENIKNKYLTKLNATTFNVGYPDWILNNTDLDNYYKLIQRVNLKKSFEAMIYLQTNSVARNMRSIRQPVDTIYE
ncbi:unnamed protein product [Oppiella nova]|uniref:Peptidase M13 N-terminal domain-containing protein n=1 Tax=Oppiella nova TaxID=334625 RepID=A0A7R9QR19_9ACAR|nr:unnamed protein product [Oppiella nova]CAG2172348.1 unnamed protein product [Oppiella nova]